MLGPSLPYLSRMYDFKFFSINLVNFSYPHLLKYLPLMGRELKNKLILSLLIKVNLCLLKQLLIVFLNHYEATSLDLYLL